MPDVMRDYLSSFDSHLSGLTGDAAAIAAVAKAYRVYFKKVPLEQGGYTMDHTASVYLMDKDGVARLRDAPAEWSRQYAMLGLPI